MERPLKKDEKTTPRKSGDREQASLANSLLQVPDVQYRSLPLSGKHRWLVNVAGQIVQGGTYLSDGVPGSGKSTLARQIGFDLASNGFPCLYILTEEPSSRLKHALTRMTEGWTLRARNRAFANIFVEGDVQDVRSLPTLLARKVLGGNAPYRGVRMIVLDSINGTGLRHSDAERWQAIYEFASICRSSQITLLMVSHVTKRGEIAGPRSLEHNIDAAIRIRKSGPHRSLGIAKNRFGPECHKLLALELDPKTITLHPSKHVAPSTSVGRSFLPGLGLVELQAAVSLPPWGTRPRTMAPNLPRKEVELLLAGLSAVPGLEFDDLSSTISCRVPGDARYSNVLGMALCVALAGSLLQRPIPPNQVMLGEIDLARSVRDLNDLMMNELSQSLVDGTLSLPMRLLLPMSAAAKLPKVNGLEVIPVRSLDQAIAATFDGGANP